MSDPTSLEAEIDVLMEEMKDWEQGMAYEWTEADRCSFLEKKRDTLKNFFMNEVAAAERKSSNSAPVADAKVDSSNQEEEERRKAEQARKDAEEAAIEAEVRRQMEEEENIRKRIAEEEAALEAEVRRQMEAEENAANEAAAVAAAAKEAEANEAAAKAAAAKEAAAKEADAKEDAAKEAAAKEAAAKEAAAKEAAAKEAAAKEAAAKEAARVSSPPASPAVPLASAEIDDGELDAALEKEFKEAQLRITRTPVGRQADLTDPSVIATYMKLRNDRIDLNWMILGYPSDSTPNKITVLGSGSGGWAEMMPQIPHEPIYIYLNYKFGDTGRAKFVFMTYVPDTLPGMKKSRVLGHRPAVEKLLKYMQLSWHVLDYNEFSEETLHKRLLAIGGANYSVQEADKGNFSSYKNTTKQFYNETEKKSSIGPVVYQTGPLTTTPMDISGRSMVAAPSDFRANIIDLK